MSGNEFPVIITGGCGFVGRHLANYLLEQNCFVHLLDNSGRIPPSLHIFSDRLKYHRIDLTAPPGLANLLEEINPREIYHLAGLANVKHSWEGESPTYLVNVIGAVNLMTAIRDAKVTPDILIVGSGEVYGLAPESEQPLTETHPVCPRSPYSASKLCQEIAVSQLSYHVKGKVVFVRPFNHIGPGQLSGFVTSDFARQIARIERGEQKPVIYVGNLSAKRDFTDVRDTVRAYVAALKSGDSRSIFNVCSGKVLEIQHVLDKYISCSRIPVEVKIDPDKFRPVDIPLLYGNADKLMQLTGWRPTHDIILTLEEILNDWRFRPGE